MSTNLKVWDANPGPISGSTPFGLYDNDTSYQLDGPSVAKFCGIKLGHPIMDVEMQSGSFYACFEESVNEYSSIINQFNIQENLLNLQGSPTSSNLTQREITPSLGRLVTIAKQYGTEGEGGDTTRYSGSINTVVNQQTYDIDKLWTDISASSDIEIKRVFHEEPSSWSQYYDPYAGKGAFNMMNEFGWANYSTAINFVMTPLYDDLLRMESLDMSNQIRKSGYGFKLVNNSLTIFPIPKTSFRVWFDYILKSERDNPLKTDDGVIADASNVSYQEMRYASINQPGRQWIRDYTCALSKELLGIIRSKYQSIPIPDNDVTLDGDSLKSEAIAEKESLIDKLREMLEKTTRKEQMTIKMEETEALQGILNRVPLKIYIGSLIPFLLLLI